MKLKNLVVFLVSAGVLFINPFVFITAKASNDINYSIQLITKVQNNPALITFSWAPITKLNSVIIYKKEKGATFCWVAKDTIPGSATSYTDTEVEIGKNYEYFIRGLGENYNPYTIVNAGIEIKQTDFRGKLLLLVDSSCITQVGFELNQLETDLTGDGWQVIKHNVPRTATVPDVKALIVSEYNADPTNLRTVFLFGHIPIPYSGFIAWDGHPEHRGAWPADAYYADMTGVWTDSIKPVITFNRDENKNIKGDGKFDQDYMPQLAKLEIARVDLFNMTSFGLSEYELLKRYLHKNHNFRHKKNVAKPQAIVDDNFNRGYAARAWQNFTTMFTPNYIKDADYFSSLTSDSYLWSYGGGGGQPNSCEGIGNTNDFANKVPKGVFTMLFGSYFGDWGYKDNFLRAPLASNGWGLACSWMGFSKSNFQYMALGETYGYSALATMRDTCKYYSNKNVPIYIGFMGDPSLRMHTVAPASNFQIHGNKLCWKASVDTVLGYNIYRKDSINGIFNIINTSLVTDTCFTDTSKNLDVVMHYMVRALKLEVSNSGSYYNLSQAAFCSTDSVKPTAPLNLKVSKVTNTDFTVSWDTASDNVKVRAYLVYKNSLLYAYTGSNLALISGLQPNTNYNIKIVTADVNNNYSDSSLVLVVKTTPDTISPVVSNSLNVLVVSWNTVVFTWKTATDNIGIAGYYIYLNDTLYDSTLNVNSYTFKDLKASTKYTFTLKAKDIAGNLSAISAIRKATTQNAPDSIINKPPNVIQNISETSDFKVNVFPNPVSNGKITVYISNHQNVKITIFNILGKKVFDSMFENESTININTGLNKGIYILKVDNGCNCNISKVVFN